MTEPAKPAPLPPPVRRINNYRVEITKPRILYQIEVVHGLVGHGSYSAFTLDGARRKARRIVERDRRRHHRWDTVLDTWTVPDA